MSAPCEYDESAEVKEGQATLNFVLITNVCSGNEVKEILKTENYLDSNRRTCKLDKDRLAIPIKHVKEENSLNHETSLQHILSILKNQRNFSDLHFEISRADLPLSKGKLVREKRNQLSEKLERFITENNGRWTADLQKDIPTAWEKHGDLVLIPHRYFRSPVWTHYAPACWEIVVQHLGAHRLAVKQTINRDGYRTPNIKLLFGDTGWVQHIDNGIKYTYDVTKCMFSAGNITEKLRVAGFDCSGETVLDLYAGIGYFTLPYLVHAKAAFVHACEWNPDSVEALRNNLKVNNVADRCQVHSGDNRSFQLRDFADIVNLGLIPSSEEGWPIACSALKSSTGGILHIHSNVESKAGGKCGSQRKNSENSLNSSPVVECCENTFLDNRPKSPSKEPEKVNDNVQNTEIDSHGRDGLNTAHSAMHNISSSHKCNKQMENKELDHVLCSEWTIWASQTAATIERIIREKHPSSDWCTKILHIEHVKSYAPHIDHLVLDLLCKPLKK